MIRHGADRICGKPFATRSEVIAPHGMAATSQPLATQVALDLLKSGGNAIDAALGANAALGLMEPTGCGIGGDLFALVWERATGRLHGINGSGRSPRSLTLEWFRDNGHDRIPAHGPLSVSVPGAVDAWSMLHERFGVLTLRQVLAPAIRYGRSGFPVSETIAHEWRRNVEKLSRYPGFREQFTVGGQAPAKAEVWKNPNLAGTLEAIAEGGRDAFYQGEMARVIADHVQAQGGFLSTRDLADHRGEWVEPVSASYRGCEVWELPPNGQGIAGLQILNLLEGFDLRRHGFGSPEHVHLFIEAKKLAFEDRARHYADPAFADVPVNRLISKTYAETRRALIDPSRAARSFAAGPIEHGDTVYLTVADDQGNMVSLIQSNYRGMGSGIAPPGLGFVLQDRGELFSLDPDHPNRFEPGKRPFHTIVPAFITRDGQPWISFGVMGADMQPQAHAQIVMNLVDFDMNLQEAGDAPRIHHGGSSEPTGEVMNDGGVVSLESGFPESTRQALRTLGHRLETRIGLFGGYQAIARNPANGVYIGASESRKDGQAAGY